MAVCVMPALRRVAAAAVPPTTRAAAPGRRAPFAAAAVPPARDPALPPFEWGVATASYQVSEEGRGGGGEGTCLFVDQSSSFLITPLPPFLPFPNR
jgi:hypothetical protein